MTTLTEKRRAGDLLKWEVDPRYTRGVGSLTPGATANAATNKSLLGLPVEVAYGTYAAGGRLPLTITEVLDGSEANANAVIIDDRLFDVAASTLIDAEIDVLAAGPALINADMVMTSDLAGNPYDMDALLGALYAVGIHHTSESESTEEQTD